jgi:outer membrane lipoprotein SlyB
VAAGAVTGAVLGAIVAGPRDAGGGAAVGAVAGAVLGGVSETAQAQEVERVNDERRAASRARSDAEERRGDGYRRAITACLTGRGYTVN